MTNRTYPTPPGIPAGSRIAGIDIMAAGNARLVKGYMLESGDVMWDHAFDTVPFDPDTMAPAHRPEPAWRQASRERAESSRVLACVPDPSLFAQVAAFTWPRTENIELERL